MRAQVISISSMPRTTRHEWEEETMLSGFTKALGVVNALNTNAASVEETKTAIENWVACGKLSAAERAALYEFFGWGPAA
jgi:hypothetical protein